MPTSTGSIDGIRIRPYRDGDQPYINNLFVESNQHGVPGAPISLALRKHAFLPLLEKSTRARLACYATSLGLGVALLSAKLVKLADSSSSWSVLAGISLLAAPPLIHVVHTIQTRMHINTVFYGYVKLSLEYDLKDIGAYYMGRVAKEKDPNCVWNSIIWVAETVEGQVIGAVALFDPADPRDNDGFAKAEDNSRPNVKKYELRRMAVDNRYRRRGIGDALIRTLVSHVRQLDASGSGESQDLCTKVIGLSTTVYQLAAAKMYEKHGWVKTRIIHYMSFDRPETFPQRSRGLPVRILDYMPSYLIPKVAFESLGVQEMELEL
ncbi:acyl-CoA N-acyltransferase [Coprinopsis marcescibilis]|uniref:Probable N-acetyltransferase 14 n=1 Tax=Coprinopsis marcescibilis TaxID=230819 RepID=A0A5C3KWR6_COPMA|nr:acyl-CoA N-acyltransferase [Coprinopsis marcescibilis]